MITDLLTRGVREIFDINHLQGRLKAGEVLRVKLGIDPSAPDLHIGHAVPLRKLRQFQDAGHIAVLIIGDYTAQIGDPTGKNKARTMLTSDIVKKNAQGYLEQAYKIIDRDKTEVRWQSEWFEKFDLQQVIQLMSAVTVNHLLSHETFARRVKNNEPLYLHEILYPVLQGFDSVQVQADVELGGIDQKFNILMGRIIQRAYQQAEQDVMLFPYLPGIDGVEKMSKSLGNTININDSPQEMFGKVMSMPDSLILTYCELATALSPQDIAAIKTELENGTNPKEIKIKLAKTIVGEYWDAEAGEDAAIHFDAVFRQKLHPETIETLVLKTGEYELGDILVNRTTLVASKSDVRRLISQKGIRKNKTIVTDISSVISPDDGAEVIIQIGSRRFLKIVWK